MGVCVTTATTSSASLLVLGADVAQTTYATLATASRAIGSCYVGNARSAVSTSCGGSEVAPVVLVAACFTSKSGDGSCVKSSVASATTAASYSLSSSGFYCFTSNCNAGNYYVSSSNIIFQNLFLLLSAIFASIIFFCSIFPCFCML